MVCPAPFRSGDRRRGRRVLRFLLPLLLVSCSALPQEVTVFGSRTEGDDYSFSSRGGKFSDGFGVSGDGDAWTLGLAATYVLSPLPTRSATYPRPLFIPLPPSKPPQEHVCPQPDPDPVQPEVPVQGDTEPPEEDELFTILEASLSALLLGLVSYWQRHRVPVLRNYVKPKEE